MMTQRQLKKLLNSGWQPLAWIPNVHDFKFKGLTKDGREFDCIVKLVDGMHSAYTLDGNPCFKELRYWKYI